VIRVAHATDIHWFVPPGLRHASPKRILGTANLYLRNRRHHFDPAVQASLVDQIVASQPDIVLISGDLTAQATDEEFARAREALDPILSSFPTLILAGNHDVYTQGAFRERRLARHFSEWMHVDDGIARLRMPGLTLLGLDPNRPHPTASGVVPPAQLDALGRALREVPEHDAVILALHYPIVDRSGALYDHWEHGLRNARELACVLESAPRRPDAIVHGHVHHGYRSELHLSDDIIPTFDPGSGGYAWMPDKRRAACFNIYEVADGDIAHVERFRFDDGTFAPEPGGAYASGR